jgi:hypothetical protein
MGRVVSAQGLGCGTSHVGLDEVTLGRDVDEVILLGRAYAIC